MPPSFNTCSVDTFSFDTFFAATRHSFLSNFHVPIQHALHTHYLTKHSSHTQAWEQILQALPTLSLHDYDVSQDRIRLPLPVNSDVDTQAIKALLMGLKPWRKGPWHYLGVDIDTEWRSDWKWQRLLPHIEPLSGRCVLDVGCGNGYFLLRMLGAGAKLALGIDPSRLFLYQFASIKQLLPKVPAYLLPLRSEHLPPCQDFDTVFCLGVLYHRPSPITLLQELYSFMHKGGQLVLETLVVDGDVNTVLIPKGRYAKMANVWFIPSTLALENWLQKVGFTHINTVDINQTSVLEQHSTEWMSFHSLPQFLHPQNPHLTSEGYPAPKRAVVIASK